MQLAPGAKAGAFIVLEQCGQVIRGAGFEVATAADASDQGKKVAVFGEKWFYNRFFAPIRHDSRAKVESR